MVPRAGSQWTDNRSLGRSSLSMVFLGFLEASCGRHHYLQYRHPRFNLLYHRRYVAQHTMLIESIRAVWLEALTSLIVSLSYNFPQPPLTMLQSIWEGFGAVGTPSILLNFSPKFIPSPSASTRRITLPTTSYTVRSAI